MYVETYEMSSSISLFSNMWFLVMFVTAVCVLFLIMPLYFCVTNDLIMNLSFKGFFFNLSCNHHYNYPMV